MRTVASLLLMAIPATAQTVGKWDRFETSVTNTRTYADPYGGVNLDVTYTRPDGSTVRFWGFYDEGTAWKLRFMPDQTGTWRYAATFSDGASGKSGTFDCVASTTPGMIAKDEVNPKWFGFKGGNHVLVRSLHIGDRFFAKNWDDPANPNDGNKRKAFLDWAGPQGYNTLSVASHYLNRNAPGRGAGWDTPDLWPLNAAEYREMEVILNDLAARRIMIFPFAGFFGKSSDFPTDAAGQSRYLKYTLARLGPYWNVLLNVAGPEPLLDNYLSGADINRLGAEIRNKDVFGHLLSVHNATGDDPFRDQAWHSYGTLQGPKTTSLSALSVGLLRNHHASKPLYAQETLWSGNQHHPNYSDAQLRKNAYVIHMSAAALNFGDMDSNLSDGPQGNSSAGFSGSMDLAQRLQGRHDIVRRVWDFFETVPFYRMSPRQDLVSAGYALAEPGQRYLVYLPSRGGVNVAVTGGPYAVQWINAQNTADRRGAGSTSNGQGLASPGDGDDWLVSLTASPGTTNQPPSVNAGPDSSVTLPNVASLNGTVSDDGRPNGTVTTAWSKVSGPGTVTFGSASTADTTASFSAAGTYVLRLTANDGALSASDDITVTVLGSTATPAVLSFTLINADSDQPIAAFDPLNGGATLNLGTLPSRRLNVRADTQPPTVGSVRFAYDGNANSRTENGAPYALAGNTGTDYFEWTPTVGSHSLTATPYAQANAAGSAGTAKTITFTVIDDSATASVNALSDSVEPSAPVEADGSEGCGATGAEVPFLLGLLALLRKGRRWIWVLLIALLPAAAPAAALFYENSGVASMEAENATSSTGWIGVAGLSGTARRDDGTRGVDGMTFEISFTQGGRFYVWLLCRHTSADGASADDAFVTLDGQKLYGSDDVTRPDGMQAATGTFSWSGRPKGPGGTTPANIAAGPVYFQVPGPGRRVLRVGSRSKGFEVDKIVLQYNDATRPAGTGPAETLAPGTAPPPAPPTPQPGTPPPATTGGGSGGEGENGDHALNDTVCGGSVPPSEATPWILLGALALGCVALGQRGLPVLLLVAACSSSSGSTASRTAGRHVFSVSGSQVLLNGQPFKVVGLRTSNALISDGETQELIDHLDTFKSYGMNTVSVYFMGSRFGDVKGYRPDATLDPVYAGRMGRILQAADDRGMVVLVGCLYWSTSRAGENLGAWGQAQANAAVANTVRWLKDNGYRNAFVDPDNEGMASNQKGWDIGQMISAGHAVDPSIMIAYNKSAPPPSNADLLIHHSPKVSGKPWIEAEGSPDATGGYWGTYSKEDGYYNYIRIGRYTPAMKSDQIAKAKAAIGQHNGYMMASTWLQCAPSEGVGGPFMNPGGSSNLSDVNANIKTLHPDAGIKWWLEAMRSAYGAWSPPSSGGGGLSVTSLMLIDADRDREIGPIADGATLNLATLPSRNLNVRADTSPSTVGSVRFGYDANASFRVENTAPYTLAGDTSGNYNPWTPSVGSHSLTGTPYSASGAVGTAGASRTVRFTVVDDPTADGTVGPSTPGGGSGGDGGCGATGAEGLALLVILRLVGSRRFSSSLP